MLKTGKTGKTSTTVSHKLQTP